ncbi:STAS domain-containing protein [Desulfitobacterium sp. Sab5]|uniref:STAS domain-containing protein n=1 Tax=Desulfitobacterium TaxID=36853 RepID=UPI003CFA31B3
MLLEIKSQKENGKGKLSLAGVLDISTVDSFKISLEYFADVQELAIDFAKIKFIDSTGVGGIIHAFKYFSETNRKIKVTAISSDVFEIFDILGLPEIFGRELFEIVT